MTTSASFFLGAVSFAIVMAFYSFMAEPRYTVDEFLTMVEAH